MGARVAQLRPRKQPLSIAVEAYRAGCFGACVGSLHGHNGIAAEALRARAFVRLSRPHDALETTERGLLSARSHAERGELAMYRATALARIGRHDDAAAVAGEAKVLVFAAASASLEGEFHALEGHRLFGAGDFVGARAACEDALETRAAYYDNAFAPHFTPVAHSRGRAYDLLGALSARIGDYSAQAAFVRASLDELDASGVEDVALCAVWLMNLSIFAREFDDAKLAQTVRERYASLAWVPELIAQQYAVLQSLAWNNALRGDHLGAFRDLRAAAEIAPSLALRLRATLDRAYLSRELHQRLSALEELEHAESLAAKIDWSCADAHAVDALLQLAGALAPSAPARARTHFARYRQLKDKLGPHAFATFDRRARAEELVADATIARAEGANDRALRGFREAFELWEACGYRWRAALAAIELAELGAEPAFAAFAEREAAVRPRSWLAHRVGTASTADLP